MQNATQMQMQKFFNFSAIGKTLMYGRQEDAHEFIKLLLDHMEKSFLQYKRATKLDHRSKETTPLNQIFGGYLRQQGMSIHQQYNGERAECSSLHDIYLVWDL